MASIREIVLPRPRALPCDAGEIAAILREEGAVCLRGFEEPRRLAPLRAEAERLVREDVAARGPDHRLAGVVYAAMARSPLLLDYMTQPVALAIFRAVLGQGCIVHHYCVSGMPPGKVGYASEVHTDVPASRVIPGYVTNVGMLLALDPFREENGAFEIAPRSFAQRDVPEGEDFAAQSVRAEIDPGDALFFNARCAHRGGINRTDRWRFGLALQACRPYMRQLFDYPRMLDPEVIASLPDETRQFLGCWVRMPVSIEEFDLPPEQRPYRPGQE